MSEKVLKHYGMADLLKFIFAIFVVMIHTSALKSVSAEGYVFTSLGITRVAVPFFFAISGYFTYKYIYDKEKWNSYIIKYFKLFLIWVVIELIFLLPGVIAMIAMNPIFFLMKLLICGVTGSLWYLFGLVLAMLIVGALVRKNHIKILVLLSAFLFVFGLSGDGYYGFFQNTFLGALAKDYLKVFIYMPFGITMSVPMLTMGVLLRKYNVADKFKSATAPFIGMIVFILLLGVEGLLLFNFGISAEFNFYIMILLATPCAVIYSIKSKINISKKTSKFFRDMSIGIYLTHQIVMLWVLNIMYSMNPLMNKQPNTLVVFGITLAISFIIVLILRSFKITRKLILG